MFGDHTLHLIYKAKDKDPDAFVELMTMYQKDMFRTAMAILKNEEDSADAIQDTILSCWSSCRIHLGFAESFSAYSGVADRTGLSNLHQRAVAALDPMGDPHLRVL